MKEVRIIGVPEHFNLPWHMAIEEGAFSERGINLVWTDIPEGTGRMCQMLQNDEADLAIILTEGILKSIADGNPIKIAQEYIASPLLWGIHVAKKSDFQSVADLKGKTAAISRFGSGSHLMAFVNAQNHHWDTKTLTFEVVNDIEGGKKALLEGKADYFMWEYFTTKPLVDKGYLRRLNDCPTPWPCFVVAVTAKFLENKKNVISHVLEVINGYTVEFKTIPSIDRTIANRYGQHIEDVKKWLESTSWSQNQVEPKTIATVCSRLLQLNLISSSVAPKKVLMQW